MDLEEIRRLLDDGRYEFSLHAQQERLEENIDIAEIEEAVLRAVLSRGLSKLADGMRKERDLQSVVEKLCNDLRKGRRPKRSIRFA